MKVGKYNSGDISPHILLTTPLPDSPEAGQEQHESPLKQEKAPVSLPYSLPIEIRPV